jgi:hypothetical protein
VPKNFIWPLQSAMRKYRARTVFEKDISRDRVGDRLIALTTSDRAQPCTGRIFPLKFFCHKPPLKVSQTLTDFRPSIYMSAPLRQ